MSTYRESIIWNYKYLLSVHEELMTRIINLGMKFEHSEINDLFAAGDTYNFEIDHFKESKDPNVTSLVEFFEELENLMNSMANINAITAEELEDLE